MGGILNIITTRQGMEGYTVTIGAKGSNTGAGGNLYGTVRHGKLTMSASYNYNYYEQLRGYQSRERTATDTSALSASTVMSNGSGKNRGNFQSGSFEVSYEIDTLRLVTASLSAWSSLNKTDFYSDYSASSPLSIDRFYRYNMFGRYKGKWSSIDGSIDFQRSFGMKDRLLTLSYKISTDPIEKEMFSDYYNCWAANDWQSFINALESQHNTSDENTL